jgi:hypothetical protein
MDLKETQEELEFRASKVHLEIQELVVLPAILANVLVIVIKQWVKQTLCTTNELKATKKAHKHWTKSLPKDVKLSMIFWTLLKIKFANFPIKLETQVFQLFTDSSPRNFQQEK